MDERLAPDFLRRMTLRYGIATLIQIAAVPGRDRDAARRSDHRAVVRGLLLLPQPKPRYKSGKEPNEAEKLSE